MVHRRIFWTYRLFGDDGHFTRINWRRRPRHWRLQLYSPAPTGDYYRRGFPEPFLGWSARPPLSACRTRYPGSPSSWWRHQRTTIALDAEHLLAECRDRLPVYTVYMMPAKLGLRAAPLPRDANGKIDHHALATEFRALFDEDAK